jgi:hypothetical protein
MGAIDVVAFFFLAFAPCYFLLRKREGRDWMIIAWATGWLLAVVASLLAALAVDSALGLPTTLSANRTQAELSYGFLGGVLGAWQGARFAALKRTGATAKHKWLNWFAVFLLIVIPVQFGQSNIQNHGNFFPGFLAGLIAAVFPLGAFVVIRQGVRALREL